LPTFTVLMDGVLTHVWWDWGGESFQMFLNDQPIDRPPPSLTY
jgi:hypothetical protein